MNKIILDLINQRGLASLMNATKWRELAIALKDIKGIGPKVRLKYIQDQPPSGFYHLEWDWMVSGDTSIIEWIEINTIHETHLGMLVPNKKEDLSGCIEEKIKVIGAPFSKEEKIIKVWGYAAPGEIPNFV